MEQESTDAEKKKDEKDLRTVFVGNLPARAVNKPFLFFVFKKYGRIQSVRVRSVAVKGTAVDKSGDQARQR